MAPIGRQSEPWRRRHVADYIRAEEIDHRRRGKDRRAREESRKLRSELPLIDLFRNRKIEFGFSLQNIQTVFETFDIQPTKCLIP